MMWNENFLGKVRSRNIEWLIQYCHATENASKGQKTKNIGKFPTSSEKAKKKICMVSIVTRAT